MPSVDDLAALPLETLRVLHRVAKTRARPFFTCPHAMIALRELVERKEADA